MDNNLRVPYSFLSEVWPAMNHDGDHEENLIDFEDELVELPPRGSRRKPRVIKRVRRSHAMPIDKFPPRPLHRPFEFGIRTGPPVADRLFFNHASNEMMPRNAQMPAIAPGTRRSRSRKYHYWKEKPHWRFENFASEGGAKEDVRSGTIYTFLSHVAIGISILVLAVLVRK